MNYLQLCQRLREKVGGAGEGPATVVSQRGEYSRYVNWVNEAWVEIQDLHPDWAWMHKEVTTNLIAGVQAYSSATFGIANFGSWDLRDIKLYDVSVADESYVDYQDYDIFKRKYLVGQQQQGRPVSVSFNRANELVFWPTPDKAYTVTADYYESATDLTNDTDVPAMPAQFHMLIVYKAMQYYGRYENAPEVKAEGTEQYYQMLERLESSQLPEITMAGSFV